MFAPAYQRRVNGGGSDYTDGQGRLWAADRAFTDGSWGYFWGGSASSTTNAIANTNDDPLYQTDHWWGASAEPGYKFSVANGQYQVTLKFAETSATAAGQRVFDVRVAGVTVLSYFDIFAVAGGANRAYDQTVTATVTDGLLRLAFIQRTGNPKINAIEITSLW